MQIMPFFNCLHFRQHINPYTYLTNSCCCSYCHGKANLKGQFWNGKTIAWFARFEEVFVSSGMMNRYIGDIIIWQRERERLMVSECRCVWWVTFLY